MPPALPLDLGGRPKHLARCLITATSPAALGEFTRPISSSDAEAQAYFDQGVQMMYAFTKEDAARSFREAPERDPNCAICYSGEAWAWGSYLNGPMRRNEAPHAWAAI